MGLTILGIDYGTTRTGLAIGNTLLKIAHPLQTLTIKNDEDKLRELQKLITEWKVAKLVIGLPSHRPDSATNQSIIHRITSFIKMIKTSTNLEVITVNEDFSSFGAMQSLAAQQVKGYQQKKHLDTMAACIILQQYFDEHCQ